MKNSTYKTKESDKGKGKSKVATLFAIATAAVLLMANWSPSLATGDGGAGETCGSITCAQGEQCCSGRTGLCLSAALSCPEDSDCDFTGDGKDDCAKGQTCTEGFCVTDNPPPPPPDNPPPPPPDEPGGGGGPPGPPPLVQGRCIQGFVQIGGEGGLCITEQPQTPQNFADAQIHCRILSTARVATYSDFRIIFLTINGISRFNPNGLWLGDNFTADDRALFGNRPITSDEDGDVNNFDGEGSRFTERAFRCAYDLIQAEVLPPAP